MTPVRCGFGLGNRVAAMANGLSRERKIGFVWRVNEHCPLGVEEVFPGGVPGVEFVDAPPAMATIWDGRRCHDWDAAGDRTAAARAYSAIVEAMAGRATFAPDAAVCGRFFRAHGDAGALGDFASRLVWPGAQVFVFADRHRAEIRRRLEGSGAAVCEPTAPELQADLARAAEDTRAFLNDWATLLAARLIVALDGPTSLLHPARAAGVPIHYAPGPARP